MSNTHMAISLGAVHRILAHGITDEPNILDSDKKSEDNNNLDTGHSSCILDSGQPGNNAFIWKTHLRFPIARPTSMTMVTMALITSPRVLLNDRGPFHLAATPPYAVPTRRRFRIAKMGKAAGKISITAIPSQETTISG